VTLDFAGRSVFVTGGSRGVGRAAALQFAKAGADVALSYFSRREAAEAVAREISAIGRRAVVVGGDHADEPTVAAMYRAITAQFGGLDVFVANAGIWPEEDVALSAMAPARWAATMRANLDGVFFTTRAALPLMNPGGSIVLVSSTAGQRGEALHADYAATKGALIALTKSLAIECAPSLTVNCCAPGWIDTDMSAGVLTPAYRARVEGSIPLRRIATADDVAGPILFLASPLARHITGEILNVNGGSVLCG
jgi:3-oxoacyl-[acyl-carrier protein] reductase